MSGLLDGDVKVADVEYDDKTGLLGEAAPQEDDGDSRIPSKMKRDALTDTHIRAYSVGHL